MAKLPFTEAQAKELVSRGHLTHSTFARIKEQDGFTRGYSDGTGAVAPENDVEPVSPSEPQQPQPAPVGPQPEPTQPMGLMDAQGNTAQAPADQSPRGGAPVEAGHVPLDQLGAATPTTSVPIPQPGPDFYQGMNEGMKNQLEGTAAQGAAEAKAAKDQAKGLADIAATIERQKNEAALLESDRQAAGKSELDKLTAAQNDLLSGKVDPDRYWHQMGTGGKITAAIAIALGGLGQGLSKSDHNPAMDVINRAIDRDIEAQKADQSMKSTKYNAQVGIYGLARQRFQDERSAELAQRSLGLQAAEMKLNSLAASNQSPAIQAKYQALKGQIQQQQTQIKQAVDFQGYKNHMLQQLGQGASQGINPEAVRVVLGNDYADRLVPGMGFAKDKDTASKVADYKSNDDAFQTDLQSLMDFAQKNRGALYGTASRAEGVAKASALQNSYRRAMDMGVFKPTENEFMKNLIGDDPTTFFNYLPQLKALGDSAKSAREAYYRTHVENYKAPTVGGPRVAGAR